MRARCGYWLNKRLAWWVVTAAIYSTALYGLLAPLPESDADSSSPARHRPAPQNGRGPSKQGEWSAYLPHNTETLVRKEDGRQDVTRSHSDGLPHAQHGQLPNDITGLKFDPAPVNRNVTDHRDPECSAVVYDVLELPTTSIIMIVAPHEESEPVIRTIHSVLNRTPLKLLAEILIVDDTGADSWLSSNNEILDHFRKLKKVRVLPFGRKERVGLLMGRQRAAEAAFGSVVTFIDSYSEVQPGWIEPMLAEIASDRKTITFPQLDWENPGKWDIHKGGIGCVLGFLWSPLSEHEISEQQKDLDERLRKPDAPTAARPSPVIFGAVFSVDKSYFFETGGFDPHMGYGGSENLELSFKTWMCGGSVKCTPCSRVYIVFYKRHTNGAKPGHWFQRNILRTATIWMDEYKDVAVSTFGRIPEGALGEVEERQNLRTKLNCRSFQWFLDKVYPENEITSLSSLRAFGSFRHEQSGKCLDSMQRLGFGNEPGMYQCSGTSGSQQFTLLENHHIMPVQKMEVCLKDDAKWSRCNLKGDQQDHIRWNYNGTTKQIHVLDKNKCLTVTANNKVEVQGCHNNDERQQWDLQSYKDFQEKMSTIRQIS